MAEPENAGGEALLDARFFALSVDLLCVVGTDGYFRRLNPAWERTLGFTIAELMARPSIELVHPDDRERSLDLPARLMRGLPVVPFENRLRCSDGSYRWIAWAFSAVRPGEDASYAIGRDVTAQRDAEASVRAKATQLEAMLQALPDILFHTGADGRIIEYNAGRASDLYVSPEMFLGKTFADVLPPALGAVVMDTIARAHRTKQVETLEYSLPVPSGNERFEARTIPMADGRSMLVVRNVTDRFRAQQALKASEERLRESEKLEATGRLAGGIAHDFNNLMMVVMMYCDALLRRDDLAAHRPSLNEIRSAGERATGLTSQLLAFARRQILSPTVLDPRAVVRQLEGMLRPLIGEHIALECNYDHAVGCVRVDRGQLEQVVLNLILNARDALPGGGQIWLDLTSGRLAVEEAQQLELDPDVAYVRLRIRDTGTGIDSETRAHIFEPFFTTKGIGRGTGLGLATVYGVVRQSGGAVGVDSALGEGTTFTVLLPWVEAPPVAAPASEVVATGGTETVLIVEDERATRRAVAETLSQLGYRTLEAANADEALAMARRQPEIDLLLTDLVMPSSSGYELAESFLASRPAARLLYMSGYRLIEGTTTSPAARVLQKPFDSITLAQAVRDALDGTRAKS